MKKSLTLTLLILFLGVGIVKAQSWEKINTGFNFILMGIEFPGGQSSIGYAGGESLTYMGDGIVIKTTNGGTTWTQLWTGTDQGIEGISFPDLNTGYVGGWSAYFAKTTDGGLTWIPQSPGTDIYFYTDVVFKDASHGIVTAQTNTGAGVYSTSDGGITWTTATGVSAIPYGACYVSGNTYFLANNNGDIQKSTDNGLTWATVYAAGGFLLGIDFYDANIGIAGSEDGRIIKTYDGGATWQQQVIAFGQPLWHDFAWANQNEVYAAGTPEFIFKSMDGGSIWTDDFPQSTYDPALYEILFTADGIGYVCGSQGWFYRKAQPLTAMFTANNTTICTGNSIQFSDQSLGSPSAWNWTFEGGTPSTSSLQNPIVTYTIPGVYDVTLTITKGPLTNTLSISDMIHVESVVTTAPSVPTGPTNICGSFGYDYTTTPAPNAINYSWSVDPVSAGTMAGTGLTATLTASNSWEGNFNIMVRGTSACGNGPWSSMLTGNLYHQPIAFFLFGGGGYCNGAAGYEVKLEDSEVGVSYELFRDGVTSGLTIPGSGELLSFGLQPAGSYSVIGTKGLCAAQMNGSCVNYIIVQPGQASSPMGPVNQCNNETSTYSGSLPSDAYELTWSLFPPEAGTITANGLSATIDWADTFTGNALLSVAGQNDCGTGPLSAPLSIDISDSPDPVVSGPVSVCAFQVNNYSLIPVVGSIYDWFVTGGTISSGQGTAVITVTWGDAGIGTVRVSEINIEGCNGTSTDLNVLINVCTGLMDTESQHFQIYPNPAKDILFIEFEEPGNNSIRLKLTDQAGRVILDSVFDTSAASHDLTLDTSQFPAGFYIVRIINSNGTKYNGKTLIIH
jgi:photosystem II stability/assembly factor-like uncharacterized protein